MAKTRRSLSNQSAKRLVVGSALDSDVVELCRGIRTDHESFVQSARTAIAASINCGRRLASAKHLVGHGRWESYFEENLKERVGFGIRTAQRHMDVYARFERFAVDSPSRAGELAQHNEQLIHLFRLHCEHAQKTTTDPNEWTSSPLIRQVAQDTLGTIECDPAATSDQVRYASADQSFFAKSDDGLAEHHSWRGRAFIAPGHQGTLTPWIDKALREFQQGTMTEGLLVLPANLSPTWPPEVLMFPKQVTKGPGQVLIPNKDGTDWTETILPCRLLFIHLSRSPGASALHSTKNDALVVLGGAGCQGQHAEAKSLLLPRSS